MQYHDFLANFPKYTRERVRSLLETITPIDYAASLKYPSGTTVVRMGKTPYLKIWRLRVAIRIRRNVIQFPTYNPHYIFIHDCVQIKFVDPSQIVWNQIGYTTKNFRLYDVDREFDTIKKIIAFTERQRMFNPSKWDTN